MFKTNISIFFREAKIRINKRFLSKISFGILLGFVVGCGLFILLHKQLSNNIIILISAFLGVFAEIFIKYLEELTIIIKSLNPLQQALGSLSNDNVCIYLSAWKRDLADIDHFRLIRNDALEMSTNQKEQPLIIGSQFVYGRGDAIALSYIYQVLEKGGRNKREISLEDSVQMIGAWGRSAICIGAHNSKTREILNKFQNTFYTFSENYSVIIKNSDIPIKNSEGIEFRNGVFRKFVNDSSDIDYAIILKLVDEFVPTKTIFIIAGLGDIGTAGAAYFLLSHFTDLPFQNDTFGVVIEVPSGYESARLVDFNKVAQLYIPKKE